MEQPLMLPPNVGSLAEDGLRALAILAAGGLVPHDHRQMVLAASSLAEAYADEVLARLIGDSGYDHSAFGRAMLAELEDRIYRSWPERHLWFAKGFSVSIIGTPAAQKMQTVAELRNALLHGNGRLTDRQSRDIGALLSLEANLWQVLDVRTERRIVHCSIATGHKAIKVVQAYILALDAEVRLRQPQVSI